MQTSSFKHVAYLVEMCVANGITDAVISPGSRNAPFIIALNSHPEIKVHLVHDERVAAFFALGISDATNQPVILNCTSGSALLNYAPGIVEAYYREKPLFILSADRPTQLIDQGDGQTMRQSGVYNNYIKRSFDLPDNSISQQFEKAKKITDEAINVLISNPTGPVHLNIPLEEPLYNLQEQTFENVKKIESYKNSRPEIKDIERFIHDWKGSSKKLIIVGQLHPSNRLKDLIVKLATNPSLAVLVENTSNTSDFEHISHCIDRSLATIGDQELDKFAPDMLISLGGAVISKRIKAYLRKQKIKSSYRIGHYTIEEDTFQTSPLHLKLPPEELIDMILNQDFPADSNYGGMWKQKDLLAGMTHQEFLATVEFSDLYVFDRIMDTLPEQSILHMGNSSVVRYCQLFDPVRNVSYLSNRGVSGIDGCTSTAAGYASKFPDKLNVVITGDISFFYDSNAFWNRNEISNLKVIVISNGGGSIFQIIPGPASSPHAQSFFAPTTAKVKGICEAFDLNYSFAGSGDDLEEKLINLYQIPDNDRPSVLEVDTSHCENAAVLANYFSAIREHQKS